MSKINSFTIYSEYYDLITLLPTKEEQEGLSLAILQYMFDNKTPELNENQTKIFNNLKRPLDKSKSKSKNKSKQNQNKIEMKSNKNQNENKNKTHQDVNVNVNDNINNFINENRVRGMGEEEETNNIFTFIESNFGRTLNSIEYEIISNWEDNELTRYAIKQAVLNQAYSVKYIDTILENYKIKGIKTVVDAQKDDKEFKERKKSKASKPIKTEQVPDWFNKNVDDDLLTDEELEAFEKELRGEK